MFWLWLVVFFRIANPGVATGMSTIFGYEGDKYAGSVTRCLKDANGNPRAVDPDVDVGIAHRYLDCGAVVYVTNYESGITIRAEVVDAGPYGAISRDPETGKRFWYIKRWSTEKPSKQDCPSQRCPVGRWRGIVDLTPKAAELLGHDGWARVKLVYDKKDLRWQKRATRRKPTS